MEHFIEPEDDNEAPPANHGMALAVVLAIVATPFVIWWLLS